MQVSQKQNGYGSIQGGFVRAVPVESKLFEELCTRSISVSIGRLYQCEGLILARRTQKTDTVP